MTRLIAAACLALWGAGSVFGQGDTRAKLDSCIGYYEFGEYQKAADSLKALLPLIADEQEEATAYKYLGFSYAMLEMVEKAKAFFRVALEKFPAMQVDTLEVPPNVQVIYKQVALEKEIETKEEEVRRSPKRIAGTAFLVSGLSLGAMGGYFLYNSKQEYDAYLAVDRPDQDLLDSRWGAHRRSLVVGSVFGGSAAVLLPLSALFYVRGRAAGADEPEAYLEIRPTGAGLVCRF
jgi:tetratricopeptide (TPR) repeat protein